MDVATLPPVELEIPHEPGNYLSFRVLSGRQMEDAGAARLKEIMSKLGMSIQDIDQMSKQGGAAQDGNRRQQEEGDPYSMDYLLEQGLTGWRGPQYGDFGPEAWMRLDERTRQWAAEQVQKISEVSEGEGSASGSGTGSPALPTATP